MYDNLKQNDKRNIWWIQQGENRLNTDDVTSTQILSTDWRQP